MSTPFQFEGVGRMRLAEDGLEEIQKYADAVIIIPNQHLFRTANERTTFADAFKTADDITISLCRVIITFLANRELSERLLGDLRHTFSRPGSAVLRVIDAADGSDPITAAEEALSNPVFSDVSIADAVSVLFVMTGTSYIKSMELAAADWVRRQTGVPADIIVRSAVDKDVGSPLRVLIAAKVSDSTAKVNPTYPPFSSSYFQSTMVVGAKADEIGHAGEAQKGEEIRHAEAETQKAEEIIHHAEEEARKTEETRCIKEGRGSDHLRYNLDLTLEEAFTGKQTAITLNMGRRAKHLSVNIPCGVEDGTRIRVPGAGEEPEREGGTSGDLYIFVSVAEHPLFRREGNDLFCSMHIPNQTSILGGHLDIRELDGRLIRATIPPGTQSGTRLRYKGRGMTILRNPARGDMYVDVIVETPEQEIKRRQEEMAREKEKSAESRSRKWWFF